MPHLGQSSLLEGQLGKKGSAKHVASRYARNREAFPAITSSAGSTLTNLHLDKGCLVRQGSWDHPRIAEARPQERGHGE